LSFAVSEAHARGMELHAWINPYRAKQSTPALAANHVVNQHPDWVFVAGSLTMLNPGLPLVRSYLTDVIADIATRYDVDGIHFDDYFYPSTGLVKQDSATYADYNPTAISTIEDWRRNNVNLLIAKVYDTLNAINSANNRNIVFGVSPFGIWKSGTPAGITGNASYSVMFCDPIAWLQAGKVDYIAPQLYWKITGAQDYNALSKWWNDQGNTYNRFIYPGLALYKMSDANNWAATEIENQVTLNRDQYREQIKGQALFSTKQIMTNIKGIKTSLQTNQFRYKSIPPVLTWKDVVCPNAPSNVRIEADTLRWDTPAAATDGDLPRKYVVYRFSSQAESSTHMNDGSKIYSIVQGNKQGLPLADVMNSYFMVTSLDKNNNESQGGAGVVLPLTGLQFTVKLSGNTSVLNWSTATEFNTLRFDIERSKDGRNFSSAGSVLAAGNSTIIKQYSFNDFLKEEGTYYYRIKCIDADGRSNYSVVRKIVYRNMGDKIVFGPNPFNSVVNLSNLKQVNSIDVIDAAGKIVFTKLVKNELTVQLQLQGLSGGSYQLRISRANKATEYIKLIKM
jgi:hypothetical protein